jgi:hypothetical protein
MVPATIAPRRHPPAAPHAPLKNITATVAPPLGHRKKLYFTIAYSARTPSFQPIFFPSA